MEKKNKLKIVILAGGKSTRMNHELPKVLVPLKGKPIIKHLLESVHKSEVDGTPVIVIGYKKELVIEKLGDGYMYAVQEEQLGTGHAVACAQDHIKDSSNVLVLYGDHPYITPKTIKELVDRQMKSKNTITMATVNLPDFEDWRNFFYKNFSRIVRDKKGKILKSVEFKDANEEERKITEVNPSFCCFNTKWLLREIKKLKNNNANKEYYLTDLVKFAINEGEKVESIFIDAREAPGINSKEELELIETITLTSELK